MEVVSKHKCEHDIKAWHTHIHTHTHTHARARARARDSRCVYGLQKYRRVFEILLWMTRRHISNVY